MSTTKKYTDEHSAFIRDLELTDPTLAELMIRVRAHDAKWDQPMYGMTRINIREMEKDLSDDERISAQEAWVLIRTKLEIERLNLLYGLCRVHDRSEAAWWERPIQRIRDAFNTFLRELRLPG